MRIVIQRTSEASVKIEGSIYSKIKRGLVVLVGIESEDSKEDADWIIQKIVGLRILSDDEGKMNLSAQDINGEFLVIILFHTT